MRRGRSNDSNSARDAPPSDHQKQNVVVAMKSERKKFKSPKKKPRSSWEPSDDDFEKPPVVRKASTHPSRKILTPPSKPASTSVNTKNKMATGMSSFLAPKRPYEHNDDILENLYHSSSSPSSSVTSTSPPSPSLHPSISTAKHPKSLHTTSPIVQKPPAIPKPAVEMRKDSRPFKEIFGSSKPKARNEFRAPSPDLKAAAKPGLKLPSPTRKAAKIGIKLSPKASNFEGMERFEEKDDGLVGLEDPLGGKKEVANGKTHPPPNTIPCPNCDEPLDCPLPVELALALTTSPAHRFCRLHHVLLVVTPTGKKCGWPLKVDWDSVRRRVEDMRGELENVIEGRKGSVYRELAMIAYKEMGRNRARSVMGVMERFQATLPGYYGPKGTRAILAALTSMFIATGYLTPRATAPQDPAEYLQQVLVPEAAVRLIRDDLRDRRTKKGRKRVQEGWSEEKELKNARSVMEESVDFGMCMHGDEEDEEDEDDEEKEEDEKYH